MTMTFRTLNANEIDCRVGVMKVNGCSLLLYKDARVDMALLDEVVGPLNWQRTHEFKEGKLYCTVSIFDKEKNSWVSKEDVGVESNTEQEKGQASDSFKRACVNVGIGRELYTAPFIWINLEADEVDNYNGKPRLKANVKFRVDKIECDDKKCISKLTILDQKGVVRFDMGGSPNPKPKTTRKPITEAPKQEEITQQPVKTEEAPKEAFVIPDTAVMTKDEMREYFKTKLLKDMLEWMLDGRKFSEISVEDQRSFTQTIRNKYGEIQRGELVCQ